MDCPYYNTKGCGKDCIVKEQIHNMGYLCIWVMEEIQTLHPIPEFPYYGITIKGYVKNIKSGRWLKPSRDDKGRLQVTLRSNGKSHTKKIKRLLLDINK